MHFLVPGVQDLAVVGFLLFALPAVLMGWYKPYNMKAEEYLKLVYYNNYIAYPTRILKTDDAMDVKLPTMKERQELERKLQLQEQKKKKAAYQAKQQQQRKGGPK